MKVTFYFITWKYPVDGIEYVCDEDGYALLSGEGVDRCLLSFKPLPPNSSRKKRVFHLYMLEVENDEVANICPCDW